VLAIAPTPAKAARLSKSQIVAALRRAGRQRGLTTFAATIQQQLRLPQLRHPALVEDAFGIQAVAVLATLDAECASVDRLDEATAAAFTQHPDHRSSPRSRGSPTSPVPAYSPKSVTTEHDSPTRER